MKHSLQETLSKNLSMMYEDAMSTCTELNCGFYFVLDSVITLTDDNVLRDLIHWNKSVITTQLTQPGQVY